MNQPSEAYTIAQELYDSFFGTNSRLTAEQIQAASVVANPSFGPNRTTQLYIHGEYDGRNAYQSLSKGRDGHFSLSTVFTDPGGEIRFTRITPQSPEERIGALTGSLFMRALVAIDSEGPQQG